VLEACSRRENTKRRDEPDLLLLRRKIRFREGWGVRETDTPEELLDRLGAGNLLIARGINAEGKKENKRKIRV